MPFSQPDSVRYYTFESLQDAGVTQAVFTRHGGVSGGPWSSLNVGLTVGDDPEKVARNRELSFAAAGRDVRTLSDSWLIHSDDVLIYDQPRPSDQYSPPKADIILTDNPEVSLFMRYADCVPILLVDPVRRAIGLAHAGWKGTVMKVAVRAFSAMAERYGSKPENLLAAFGADAGELLPQFGDSTHLDLWAANHLTLAEAGVKEIEVAGLCTAEHTDDWFSHRAEDGKTGRFGVLLALEE